MSVFAIVTLAGLAIGFMALATARIPQRPTTPIEAKCLELGIDAALAHKCETPYAMPRDER